MLVQIANLTTAVPTSVLTTKILQTIPVTTKLLEIFQSDATATWVQIATLTTVAKMFVLITGIQQTVLALIRLLEICQMDAIAI